jgi:hypothetical protein
MQLCERGTGDKGRKARSVEEWKSRGFKEATASSGGGGRVGDLRARRA